MNKKFLATAMAACVAITAVSANAATNLLSKSETIGSDTAGFWSAHTSAVPLAADADVTLTFTTKAAESEIAKGMAGQVYYGAVYRFSNEADATNENRTANYMEYAVLRGDNYGWGLQGSTTTANKTTLGGDMTYSGGFAADDGITEDDFKTIIFDATVTSNIKRTGETLVVTEDVVSNKDASKKYRRVATLNKMSTSAMYVGLTVDHATVTLSSVVNNVAATPDAQGNTPTPAAIQTAAPTATPSATAAPTATPEPTKAPSKTTTTKKKSMTVKVDKVKAGAKKITGTVSVKGAKVTVTVKSGKKTVVKNAKATVKAKKYTLKLKKKQIKNLKKNAKVTVKATKSGYKTATKTVKVKK